MSSIETRLQGAPNFRDLGGARMSDGRSLRHGRVYRSEVLSRITDEDLEVLRRLRIATVCDLRHGAERTRQLNRWPAELQPEILGLPPSEGMEAVQAGGVQNRVTEPDFDPAEGKALLMAGYRRMPRSLAPSLGVALRYLAKADSGPLLIHCTSGKDRSGFVCAMLLTVLDMPQEQVFHDYLLSRERHPVEHTRQLLHRALGDTLPPGRMELLLELTTAHADYLAAAFDQIDAEHGGIDNYLCNEVGLDADDRRRLQDALLI